MSILVFVIICFRIAPDFQFYFDFPRAPFMGSPTCEVEKKMISIAGAQDFILFSFLFEGRDRTK